MQRSVMDPVLLHSSVPWQFTFYMRTYTHTLTHTRTRACHTGLCQWMTTPPWINDSGASTRHPIANAEVVKWLQDVPSVRDVKWLQKQKLQDLLAAVGCDGRSHGRGLALIVLQSKLPVPHCMQVSVSAHEFNSFISKDSSAPVLPLLPFFLHRLNISMWSRRRAGRTLSKRCRWDAVTKPRQKSWRDAHTVWASRSNRSTLC